MNLNLLPPKSVLPALFLFLIASTVTVAQIGINTTTPSAGAMLDIDANDKGVLIPRVDIADLATIAPVTGGATTGLLVYNTNGTTGPGFFYWDGSQWTGFGGGDDWALAGNTGTTPGTGAGQDFVGTTDAQDLVLASNGSEVARITTNSQIESVNDGTDEDPAFTFSNDIDTGIYLSASNELGISTGGNERLLVLSDGRIRSFTAGTNAAPLFSWDADDDTGFWRSGDDRFNLSAGGLEFIELNNDPNVTYSELVVNDDSQVIDTRIETNNDDYTVFVSGTNDNVGIGTGTAAITTKLEVNGGANDGIFGYSNNVGGYLGRETNISFGNPVQTILGAGVYANNPFAGYTSTYAQSTGAATVAASVNYSDVWIANYSYVESNSNAFNPSAAYAQLNINDSGLGGIKTAFRTYTNRGTVSGNPGFTAGAQLQAVAQNEDSFGVYAAAFSDTGGTGFNAGGYFASVGYSSGFTNSWSYVAGYIFGTNYKIVGSGVVSTVVTDENNDERIMFAPESPEVVFQDYGVGKLVNGVAQIQIDPILSRNILVDANHPLKVFVTLEGDCNGIFVTNKSADGFTVKELQGGTSNIDFSWQIVATRVDNKDSRGQVVSKYQDLRFPKFPEEAKRKLQNARSQNSGVGNAMNVSKQ